jgi:pimeloyl-ACP methyl ester carboxylesterase
MPAAVTVRHVEVRGVQIEVATAGAGPAVLLVHGIPHTWFVWRRVIAALADRYLVIAPDLRGLGGSERTAAGFDVTSVASDLEGLLDVLGIASAAVVGLDLGVQTAFVLGMTAAARIRRVAVMEGLVGALPGAESFFAKGPPWWFGFHAVPALPETLIVGHEVDYVDYFLANGTYERRGVAADARDRYVRAYTGREAVRCMCEHYRAMAESARQIARLAATRRLDVPVLAIAGGVVGGALAGQLRAVAARLSTAAIERTAHIIPEDQPEALVAQLEPFLATP